MIENICKKETNNIYIREESTTLYYQGSCEAKRSEQQQPQL
jgi:hypothetical protein